jgi:hypothetical protein
MVRPVPTRFSRCVTCPLQKLSPVVSMARGTRRSNSECKTAMMAYVVSEGRLFWLKPSEWSVLLVSVALCGFLTLFF